MMMSLLSLEEATKFSTNILLAAKCWSKLEMIRRSFHPDITVGCSLHTVRYG
jgi:hypothetical protein